MSPHGGTSMPAFSWSRAIAVVVSLALLITLAHPKVCDVAATTRNRAASAMDGSAGSSAASSLISLYLDTMKRTLIGMSLRTPARAFRSNDTLPYEEERRMMGHDWPLYGVSMIGLKRMSNIQELLENVLAKGIPGDYSEFGVWRGGASIFARAVLKAHGVEDRTVHVFDSFEGLPKASTGEDSDSWSKMTYLMIPLEEVQSNFDAFGLLDAQTQFHQGFFRTSCPQFRNEFGGRLSIVRLDGDMYESTMDILYNVYEFLSVSGYVIIDDYSISVCKKAIQEFMERNRIEEKIISIDAASSYWQKTKEVVLDHEWYAKFNAGRSP